MTVRSSSLTRNFLFAAFALSGFSGLIYESVWTNYIKLFVGHAAYAQALVLALFMGGMAGGAWLCGRMMGRLKNPLKTYAIVEAVIGLSGLAFHAIFVATSGIIFDSVLPGIDTPWIIDLIRWSFAGLLILPQTLLLGATFPLMSVGILRAFPATPGRSISLLYFTNSIGAVVGVLVSGFILIGWAGLPGTVAIAGLINLLLAALVFAVSKELGDRAPSTQVDKAGPAPLLRPMLVVALVTGLSSFIYEISWMRMLTMVMGASTHAFELMLSAFILGIALGGLWLGKRIDRYRKPLLALGVIQLLMGGFALLTVLGYNSTLSLMLALLKGLQQNESGYLMYNLSSHMVAIALMLPTTFMAGMTIPMITYILYRQGGGEAAVGKVYSFNTLGAIAGVLLATLLLLPYLGLKQAVIVGAALDLLLGLYLLLRGSAPRRWQLGALAMVVVAVAATLIAPAFNVNLMASSIFRAGSATPQEQIEMVMHRDGRTASVDVFRHRDANLLILSTNGKPDASFQLDPKRRPSSDEPTMALLGGLPLLINPDLKTAAMIGMGAGMSSNVILTSRNLQQLDTIEIEGAIIEGARLFGPASARVFSDPRSAIHIDDAKSYLSAHKKRYDVIVSEPSDTWVSGVSTLFTQEFYGRMRKHLNQDGLLVQWVATYGSSPEILASVLQAIGNNFNDYRIYGATDSVIVIVAKVEGKVPELDPRGFDNPALQAEFSRIGLQNIADVHLHELGRKAFLHPLFESSDAPPNSDFYPFVDQHALKARFLGRFHGDLTLLRSSGIPLPGINFNGEQVGTANANAPSYTRRTQAQNGRKLAQWFAEGASGPAPATSPATNLTLAMLRNAPQCADARDQAAWQDQVLYLAMNVIPATNTRDAQPMLAYLKQQLCASPEAQANRALMVLMQAMAERNMAGVETAAVAVLQQRSGVGASTRAYALDAVLLAYLQQEKWEEIRSALSQTGGPQSMFAKVAHAHAYASRAAQ